MNGPDDKILENPRHFRRDCIDLRKMLEFGGIIKPEVVAGLFHKLVNKMADPNVKSREYNQAFRTLLAAAKVDIEAQKLELLKHEHATWADWQEEVRELRDLGEQIGVPLVLEELPRIGQTVGIGDPVEKQNGQADPPVPPGSNGSAG